jgi:hypothetical protein
MEADFVSIAELNSVAVDITRGGGGAGVQQSAPGCSVYLSYSPDNAVGKSIANYVKTAVLERHGAACVVLTPDDGKFNYVDFAALIQVWSAMSGYIEEHQIIISGLCHCSAKVLSL